MTSRERVLTALHHREPDLKSEGLLSTHEQVQRPDFTMTRAAVLVARAGAFLDAATPAGSAVVVQGWNDPRFIALREAFFRTGRTFAAVSPTATEGELAHVLKLTNASLFLRSPKLPATTAACATAFE